jgi:hypothetical protein
MTSGHNADVTLDLYTAVQVHLHTSQSASAFHYLSASINLKPDFPHR